VVFGVLMMQAVCSVLLLLVTVDPAAAAVFIWSVLLTLLLKVAVLVSEAIIDIADQLAHRP